MTLLRLYAHFAGLVAFGFQVGFVVRYAALTIAGKIRVRVGVDVVIVAVAQAVLLLVSNATLGLMAVRAAQPWRTATLAFLYTVLIVWMHRVFVDIGVQYRVQIMASEQGSLDRRHDEPAA